MRRAVCIVFGVIACVLLLTGTVFAADAEISSLTTDVTVNDDGSAQVTVTAETVFSAPVQSVRIPLGAGAKNIVLSGWAYRKTTVDGVTCLVVTNDAGFSGKQTFACTYTLPSSVTESASGQSFRLYAPQTGWEFPIDQMTLRVTFPFAVTSVPTWTSGYFDDIIDNYLNIDVTENTVTATSITALKDHETLRMDLQFDMGSFRIGSLPGATATADTLLFFALFLLAPVYWFFFLRYGFLLPHAQQTAGTDFTAGEVPCQLYGKLADPGGMLAHWGNLGYVRIVRSRRGRVLLYKQMEMGNERKPVERKFFNTIFRNSGVCDADSRRFAEASRQMRRSVRRGWLRRLFSPRSGSPLLLRGFGLAAGLLYGVMCFDLLLPAGGVRWIGIVLLALLMGFAHYLLQRAVWTALDRGRRPWLLLGFGALVFLVIVGISAGRKLVLFCDVLLQIFCALTTIFGGKRTRFGQEQAKRLLGLRRFLRRAGQAELQKLMKQDPQYFYRMLPFADALGVAAPFVRHTGKLTPEACEWLVDAERRTRTPEDFYQLYLQTFSVLRAERYRPPAAHKNRRLPPRVATEAPARTAPQRPHRRAEYDYDE